MPSSALINKTFELAQEPGVRFMATVFQQDYPGEFGSGVCCGMASLWIDAVLGDKLVEFRAKVRRDNDSPRLTASSEFVARQMVYRERRNIFLQDAENYRNAQSARLQSIDIRNQLVREISPDQTIVLNQRWTRAIQAKNDARDNLAHSRAALHRFYGGEQVTLNPVSRDGFPAGEFVNAVEDVTRQCGIYFFMLNISAGGDGSHAIALVKDTANCKFFDATTGEWEVDCARFGAFFKKYVTEIYTTGILSQRPIYVFFGPRT